MTLYEFINTIKTVSLKKKGVEEFRDGDVYEQMNSKMHRYPAIVLTISTINRTENRQLVNCTLFYIDRLTDDASNKTEIQSNGLTCLKQIIEKLNEDNTWNFDNEVYTPFSEKFSDMCTGVFVSGIFSISEDIICADDSFTIKELKVAENGIYDVVGYDRVIVEVKGEPVEGQIGIELSSDITLKNNKISTGKPISEVTVNAPEKIDFDLRYYGLGGSYNTESGSFYKFHFINTGVHNMYYTFTGCSMAKTIDLSDLIYNVPKWRYTFEGCDSLEEVKFPYNLTVDELIGVFQGMTISADILNNLGKTSWNGQEINAKNLFNGATLDFQHTGARLWLSKPTMEYSDLSGMFRDAIVDDNIVTSLYTHQKSEVVRCNNMFADFSIDNENVAHRTVSIKFLNKDSYATHFISFQNMFQSSDVAYVILTLDTTATYSVQNFNYMFYNCTDLKQLDFRYSKKSTLGALSNAENVFTGCVNLKYINVSNEFEISYFKEALKKSGIPDNQVAIGVLPA